MEQTDAFQILASADRQITLHELIEKNGKTTIEELSEQVAARRHRISSEQISDEKVEHARVRLVHIHFPQLIEADIIDIDWSEREVVLTKGECFERLFKAAEELDSWPPDGLLEQLSR